ncbi:MAG: mechanosensitive ion channel family protein [Fibrobacterota bacterium]
MDSLSAILKNWGEMQRFVFLAVIPMACIAARFVFLTVMRTRIKRLTERTKTEYDDRLLEALIPPAVYFIYLAGYYLFVQAAELDGRPLKYAYILLKLFVGFNSTYMAFRLINVVELYFLKLADRSDNALDSQFAATLRKALKLLVLVVAAIVIADNLGYNVSGLIAGLGIGGLAVALAAQDTLANFFGSITLVMDKPFKVQERIKVMTYDGIIEKIGLRSVRLRTFDGHLVTIPNKELANASIENVSERQTIRTLGRLNLTYAVSSEEIEQAISLVRKILESTDHVTKEYKVYFEKFASYSLDLYYVYWVSPADYWLSMEINEKINLAVKRAFDARGIAFAFPTQTIQLERPDAQIRNPKESEQRV